jgi:5-methylcytosine-specific restriction protein A
VYDQDMSDHRSDELRAPFAEHDRSEALLVAELAAFDAVGGWDDDDATSMVAWLRDRCRMSARDAQRLVKLARATAALPGTAEAWTSGVLSSGQVHTIVSIVGRKVATFAEHEATLVPTLAPLSLPDTVEVLQEWRRRADAEDGPDPDAEPSERPSTLYLSTTFEGRGVLSGDLTAEDSAIIAAALRVAESRDQEGEPARTPAERRADAAVDVSRFFLDNQRAKAGGRHRPHLNLVVHLDDFEGGLVAGAKLPRSVVERYCCDSGIHRVLTDGRSAILDVGTATRTITAALWMALVLRDGECRFPGCDRPATWCDGHHIHWFSRGGPTRLDNLVLLCRRHHRRLHEPGWHAKLLPDGRFEVTSPDGLVRSSHPPGTLQPFP